MWWNAMRGKLRELMAWELQDTWAFPILEIVIAICIIQVMSITSYGAGAPSRSYFESMLLVIVISSAIVFAKSFGESIEKRKLIVLLSYPVSRRRLFIAKYLANLLVVFLIFGFVLFAEGVAQFAFASGSLEIFAWTLMFLYLFLVVFFASSLMTFLAIAVKRFGLSIFVFLIYMFGMEYWLRYPIIEGGINNPLAHLSLDLGPWASIDYVYTCYVNWLNIGIHAGTQWTQSHFLAALGYLVGGGLALFLASLFLINKMDLD